VSTTAPEASAVPGSPDAQREASEARDPALRVAHPAGRENLLSRRKKSAKRARNALLRCACRHAKSIHARMYGNRKLGTPCNFPGCRCKAYRVA